jgi:hypothetical protein
MSGVWSGEAGPAIADLDGDGAADLALVSLDGYVRVLRGMDGMELWSYAAPGGLAASVPSVGDLDGDGQPEVAALLRDRVVALHGSSGTVLWEAMLGTAASPDSPAPLVLLDVDGDGSLEVAHLEDYQEYRCLPPPYGYVCFWVNVPFLQVRNGATGAALWDSLSSGLPAEPSSYSPLAAGDLDGDGSDEVVLGTLGGPAALGEGGALRWVASIPDCAGVLAPALADTDSSPGLEVVVACSSSTGGESFLAVLSGASGALLRTVGLGTSAAASTPVSVADLDGDGDSDAVLGLGSVVVATDLTSGVLWSLPLSAALRAGLPVADLDGDSAAEVLVLDSTAWESLRLVSGASGAVLWDSASFGLELAGASQPALGDLDGDGWLEIGLVRSDPYTGEGAYVALDSLTTGGPAGSGAEVEQVLWQTDRDQDLAASEAIALSENIGLLGVTGQLWFRGWLSSSLGQVIASDSHPFWITDGDLLVGLATDQPIYLDGSNARVSGVVRELSGLDEPGLVLQVTRPGGENLFSESFDLPAGGVHNFAFDLPVGAVGAHDLVADLFVGAGAAGDALARYRVVPATVQVAFEAPEAVGPEQFELAARLESSCELALSIEVGLTGPTGTETRSIELAPGGVVELRWPRAIWQDETFALDVSGGYSHTDQRLVRFGPAAVVSAAPFAFYSADEPVDIPWTVANTGLIPYLYGVQLEIVDTGGQSVAAYQDSFFLLEPGDPAGLDRTVELWSLLLNPGDYALRWTVDWGSAGRAPFTVGLPLAAASVSPEPVYPAGPVAIPWSLANLTPSEATFAAELSLERDGLSVDGSSLSVSLRPAGTPGDSQLRWFEAVLEPGAYRLHAGGPRVAPEAEAWFEVLPETEVSLEVATLPETCGPEAFDLRVANLGFAAFEGQLAVRSPFFEEVIELSAAGQGGQWTSNLSIGTQAASIGDHQVAFALYDAAGVVRAETSRTAQVRGGLCALAQVPAFQSAAPGSQVAFAFVVENQGDQPAICRLWLEGFEEQGPEQVELALDPCEQGPANFAYLLPWDLEARQEHLRYRLTPVSEHTGGQAQGFVDFAVDGLSLDVTASLDRCFYRPGETALFNLQVANLSQVAGVPLTLEVSYPGFEEQRGFVLDDQTLQFQFEIPLGDIPAGRITYTFSFPSGRVA